MSRYIPRNLRGDKIIMPPSNLAQYRGELNLNFTILLRNMEDYFRIVIVDLDTCLETELYKNIPHKLKNFALRLFNEAVDNIMKTHQYKIVLCTEEPKSVVFRPLNLITWSYPKE